MSHNWTTFSTPIAYFHSCVGNDGEHGWMLAWRFMPENLTRIEYLNANAVIIQSCVHLEFYL
jgi:hypothetical protein